MKEKILAFLKSKLTGVSESYINGVAEHYSKTISEETQIATTFSDGVVDLLKLNAGLLQKEGDRRATEASNTAVKTFREKHGIGEDGKPLNPGDPPKTSDPDPNMPEWAKKLIDDNQLLKTKLENQEKEKTSAALSERVLKHDKLKDIPASWLKGRNITPATEADIETLVASVESDYNAFKQELTEKGVFVAPPQGGGGPKDDKTVTEDVKSYLEEKFPTEKK
mgnify:CR=1 FL=1